VPGVLRVNPIVISITSGETCAMHDTEDVLTLREMADRFRIQDLL